MYAVYFTLLASLLYSTGSLAANITAPNRRLEEVVVSAQHKPESAQYTPISLVSFDREKLEVLSITNIEDIRSQVPNFQIDNFPSSNQTLRLFIRGIGIGDVQITQDPAVGVYIDGVYLARSTGLATEVADLERIEVLRGPQGTLYGRNTTGGALNLITARPGFDSLEFEQTLGAGNRGRQYAKSMLNLPLGDRHAIKLSALYERLDGFVDNTGPGGDFGDRKAGAYRVDWRWQISGTTTLDYAFDQSTIESFNYTPQAVQPGIPSGTPADAAIISSQRFVQYSDRRFSTLATSVPLQANDTETHGHSLTAEWSHSNTRIKSITAWRELSDDSYIEFASGASSEYRVDFGAITLGEQTVQPLPLGSVKTRVDQQQFSQELQLFGTAVDAWEYIAGIYFFEEKARENWFPMHHIFSFPLLETGDTATAVNLRAEDNDIENTAAALYGQITWTPVKFASKAHFTVGWRHSRDWRDVDRVFLQDNYIDFGDLLLGPLESIDFAADASNRFDDDSFQLMLEYDWTDNLHGYSKYVEAYKSGGYNTRDPDPDYFAQGFGEEKNRTIELGFKGELLNNQLRVNGAVFYSKFEDLQQNFLLPGGISDTRVFNSGSAATQGFEMTLASTPWYGLLCTLNYAYLDTRIDDVNDPFTGTQRSFSFASAPAHSAALSLDYQIQAASRGQWLVNVNYSFVDERRAETANLDRESHQLLNGRIALANMPMLRGKIAIALWVKNALDEDYVAFAIDNLPHASRAVLWGETRTWGLDLKYAF
jgi:iron complex outermembrane receptor protein